MKYAFCNEIFGDRPWKDVCSFARKTGFDGIEIAPFTFAESVRDIGSEKRKEIAMIAKDNGLEITGLHMLLYSPKGLHANHPDPEVRTKAAEYIKEVFRFCADIGGTLMTYGSPGTRNVHPDLDYATARDLFRDTLLQCLPVAEERGLILCIEPLASDITNLFNSLEATLGFVREIGRPSLGLMIDCKAATVMEQRPLAEIIKLYAPYIRHVHGNDTNNRTPGLGSLDYGPVLKALMQAGYSGYLSLEPFDYKPDPETIASVSLKYLRSIEALL
jgi:sugar phosphate isomerase/epimerase